MAKKFTALTFNLGVYEKELSEFKSLLDDNYELGEHAHILPFFKARPTLSSQIATLNPYIRNVDQLAFEFDIFGDFATDIAAGDTGTNTYCFIEFEDARAESIFRTNGQKYKHEFSARLEHGFSQIIDWFYKLDGLQNSNDFEERFGKHKIDYEGILIIGRDHFLDTSLKSRLNWRAKKTVINSKHVFCYTFDELYMLLAQKIDFIRRTTA